MASALTRPDAVTVGVTWFLLMQKAWARWEKQKAYILEEEIREARISGRKLWEYLYPKSTPVPACPTCGTVPEFVTTQDGGIDWLISWGCHVYIVPLTVLRAAERAKRFYGG